MVVKALPTPGNSGYLECEVLPRWSRPSIKAMLPRFRGILHVHDVVPVRKPEQAREFYEASLAAIRSPGQGQDVGNDGDGHSHNPSSDEELTSMFLIATAVVPALYGSNDHIAQVCVYRRKGGEGVGVVMSLFCWRRVQRVRKWDGPLSRDG